MSTHLPLVRSVHFHRFVAVRYLTGAHGGEEGRRFLRLIMVIAIGGVAVGVAMLLLALSIVRGFSREIEAKIIGFGAHVQVENIRHAPLPDAEESAAQILALPGVAGIQPVVAEFALLRQSRSSIEGVGLWGTDSLPTYVRAALTDGLPDLATPEGGKPRLIVGQTLATLLGLSVGNEVVIFSTRAVSASGGGGANLFAARPRLKSFEVSGVYETSLADFDETYVFADIGVARNLLSYGSDQVTRLDVTLTDPTKAEAAAREIEAMLGVPVLARSIYTVYRGLFAWIELQESIIPLVIGILMLVAAFNILGTLLMVIMEKTRDIGIFASMGTSRMSLQRLFLSLGLMIGAVGTLAGLLLALGLGLIQMHYGIIPLPAEAYYMTTAPVALHPMDFALISVAAMALTAVAAYLPARAAARVDPVKVIGFR